MSEQVRPKKKIIIIKNAHTFTLTHEIKTRRPSVNFLPSKNSSLVHRRYRGRKRIFLLMGIFYLFSLLCFFVVHWLVCVCVFVCHHFMSAIYCMCIRCVCFYSIPFIAGILNFHTKFSIFSLVLLHIWLLLHSFSVRLSSLQHLFSSFREKMFYLAWKMVH